MGPHRGSRQRASLFDPPAVALALPESMIEVEIEAHEVGP
jgi:hypothetical protein